MTRASEKGEQDGQDFRRWLGLVARVTLVFDIKFGKLVLKKVLIASWSAVNLIL